MESAEFAFTVAILAFGAGVFGLKLHVWLPEEHAPDRAREMIGAMTGLLGLLLALVLGTLIGASYTLYATQKSELETLEARTLQLDAALKAYGPEAEPGREGLRTAIKESFNKVWGGAKSDLEGLNLKSVVAGSNMLDQFLLSLTPKTDAQKQMLSAASSAAGQIEQTRLLMMLQLASGISWPMVTIVVGWSLLLFCGYGLASPVNATVIATLGLGAAAVASAIFLIVELSQPYSGWFRIPAAGMIQTIEALGS
jgi:hypothetical protein